MANYSATRAVEVARLRLTQVLIRTLIYDFGLHGHDVVARLRRERPADYFRLVMIALQAAFDEAEASSTSIDIYKDAELRSASAMAEAIERLSRATEEDRGPILRSPHPGGIASRLRAPVRRATSWWSRLFVRPEAVVTECDSTENLGAGDGETQAA